MRAGARGRRMTNYEFGNSASAGDGAILGTGPELTNCKFRQVRVSF